MIALGIRLVNRSVIKNSYHFITAKPVENLSKNMISYRFSTEPPKTEESKEENPSESNIEPPVLKTPEQELIEKLKEEIKDLKDQVLRSLAEEENTRRIAKRDVAQAKAYANSSFAKSLLEVADTLEMALKVDTSKLTPEKSFQVLVEGITVTEKNLQKVFEKNGIKKYGTVGDVFDPNFHEALYQIPDPTKPNGTIGQIVKAGYKLNDRVIRAAEVGTITHN